MRGKILTRNASVVLASCIVLLFLASNAVAQLDWVSLDGSPENTPPTVEVTNSTTDSTTLRVVVHGFWDETTSTLGLTYHKISLPNSANADPECRSGIYGTTMTVGKSAIPFVHSIIGIRSDITAANIDTITLTSGSIFTDHRVFPYLEPVTHGESEQFIIDAAHYASTAWYPYSPYTPPYSDMNYAVEQLHVMPIAQIPICNFFAMPASEELHVYWEATVQIDTIGTAKPIPGCSDAWYGLYEGLIDNFVWLNPWRLVNPPLFRIYAADSYVGVFEVSKIIKWKQEQGFVVSTKSVPAQVANNFNAIYNHIKTFYTNNSTRDIFILLIGDVADIATGSYNSEDSDYKYTLVNGNDDYADLFIGRISVDNSTDVTNALNKIIKYEKNPPTGNWLEEVVLAAYRNNTYKGHKEAIRTNAYSKKTPTFTTRYGVNVNGTNTNVKSDINNHCGIVNYDGHGSFQAWTSWEYPYPPGSFTIADIGGLTNGDYTPIIVSTACHNGEISLSDCIGEEWLEAGAKGAAAHLGGSGGVYTNAGGDFDKYIFEKIFDDGVYHLGCAMVQAHHQTMKNRADIYSKRNAYMYILLGDPSMRVRTIAPLDFDDPVNGPNPVGTGWQFYTVTVKDNGAPVSGAIVAVEKLGDFFKVGKTDASGNATFWIHVNVAGNVEATVSKHNYITWEGNPQPLPGVTDWEKY